MPINLGELVDWVGWRGSAGLNSAWAGAGSGLDCSATTRYLEGSKGLRLLG